VIDDTRAEAAVMHIRKSAETYAKAKAQRIYLEEFKRTKRAILMQQAERSGHTTSAAQEREAYANPEYNDLLEGLRVAIETEERIRWEMVSAELTVDIWRTQKASARMLDRSAT
jgi:hypothetical protein